jgi:hypothetical protein
MRFLCLMWIIRFPLDVCPAQLSALTVRETYFETATLGQKMDLENQSYIVSSASVLKSSLLKYKCSDEP